MVFESGVFAQQNFKNQIFDSNFLNSSLINSSQLQQVKTLKEHQGFRFFFKIGGPEQKMAGQFLK